MEMNQTENALLELENELHTELLPGTEIMKDAGQHHFIKSQSGKVVLVPQPSNDPNDPLNWSFAWKTSAIAASTLVTFVQGLAPLAIAPVFPELIKSFHTTLDGAIQFTGTVILAQGFSNFMWIPLSQTYGRRFVLLTSSLMCVGAYAWRASATSYNSFMGASALAGIAAGVTESIQPQVITDVIFLDQRGLYNTIYFVFFYSGIILGPIIEGSMAQSVGWRNYWWLNVALNAFSFFVCLVAFPETKWHRSHPSDMPNPTITQAASPPTKDKEQSSDVSAAKVSTDKEVESMEKKDVAATVTTSDQIDESLGIGKPCKTQWLLVQHAPTPLATLAYNFFLPWRVFCFPIVQFAAFVVSFSSSCFLILTFVQSQAFEGPPYHFNARETGFTNFACLVGAFIGLATSGPASDWVSAKLTARNNGIREPEMRLLTMIPYVLIMILGNFIVAFGLENGWDWRAVVIVGFTCAGIQIAALPAIASTYAVDSYKPVTGAIFISITINKNVWGYGMGKFITPWVEKAGYLPPFMTNMCLLTLWLSFGVVFWFWGKRCRKWTAKSSVHKE